MRSIKKFIAAVTAVSLASGLAGCTPSIGSGSTTAMTVDGYEIPAGLFIYYSMQSYNEASQVLQNENGAAPELKDVRNAKIDEIDSTDWIQNKATDYCVDFAGIEREFEAIGGVLSQEEKDEAKEMAAYYYAMDPRLTENGVSEDSMLKMAESSYKEQAIFKYYYGFDGTMGCSEEELKDYFDENFARVKLVNISLLDSEGEKVSPDKERELRNMAKQYADEINKKSGVTAKLNEMNNAIESYNEYVAKNTAAEEDETEAPTTTTTTTTAENETTTTTTTDPHANERLIQKQTTTSADEAGTENTETETTEETDAEKNTRKYNEFIFNDLPIGEAVVYDYSEDTIYVIMRADLRERMTEDDYWTEDYIVSLQSMKYYKEFTKMLDDKADAFIVEKNKSAFRRYSPFKLTLEA